MKRFRYLALFLIAVVLVGCAKPAPNPRGHWKDRPRATSAVQEDVKEVQRRERTVAREQNVVVKVFRELFERTVGRLDIVRKQVIKKTMVPLYKDVLDGEMPYAVERAEDATYIEQTVSDLPAEDTLLFTFYDHPAFDYPLLILCHQISGDLRLFSIVQFFSDGSYSTFSSLEPGEISIFSTNLYTDSEGNLYIDNMDTGEIFEINVVDGILKIDYGYSPDGKGFATTLTGDFSSENPDIYIEPDYADGTDLFVQTRIIADTLEPFDRANFDALRSELRPIELMPYDDDNFYEIAGRYTDLDAGKAHKADKGFSEKEFRAFIDENLDPYVTENGTECVFIDDYNHNGKLAAYVITGEDAESSALFFINEELVSTPVEKLTGEFFYYRDPKLLRAGKDAYLLLTANAGGPGITSYLYGVEDDKVYWPDISSNVQLFDRDGERFSDSQTYLETTDTGGVRKEKTIYYDYDQHTRQFIRANDEKSDAGTENIALNIDGKDAGSLAAVEKDGALYLPVGEFNLVLASYFKYPGVDREDLELYLANVGETLAEPIAGGNGDWNFGAFPPVMEYLYHYSKKHQVILSTFELMDLESQTPPDRITYLKPTHPPFVEGDSLYMDVETLSSCFVFSYQFDKNGDVLNVKQIDGDDVDDAWKSVPAKGYRDVQDFLDDRF
ncbi:MAG: hypothetical protein PUG99_04690 [Firmicutes bacterium]|nr:hypothetical protein [Bacillota bacterium]